MTRFSAKEFFNLVAFFSLIGISHSQFSYKFIPESLNILKPGENGSVELFIKGVTEDILIELSSSNEASVRVLGNHQFKIENTTGLCDSQTTPVERNVSITVDVEGVYVGFSELNFEIKARDVFKDPPYQVEPYSVAAGITTPALRQYATYILMAWIVTSYITMGTKITWKTVKPKFYRPHGILIGIACQFVIMPGLSFLLAKATSLEPTGAVGIIIVGSCPGGWLSNIITALLDCDLVLSLTMTLCSTILALGFMPLNMFLYATPYTKNNENLRTPFTDIFVQLTLLVIPVFIGIFIRHKFPKIGDKLSKLIKPVAFLMILVALAMGLYSNFYVFSSPFSIWLSAALLPFIGGLLGLIIAKVTCLANRSAVTVGLETGAQNSFLANSMATLSYPPPESFLISRAPFLVALMTLCESIVAIVIYLLMTKFPGRPEGGGEDEKDLSTSQKDPEITGSTKKVAETTGSDTGIQADFEDIVQSNSHYSGKEQQNGSIQNVSSRVNSGYDASTIN